MSAQPRHARPARDLLLDAETEAGFQVYVETLARLHGWRVWHDRDSRRNDRGLPDLLLVRGQRLVYAELKRQRGRLRPEQREWLADLAAVGGNVEAYLWRPSDRADIERILA